MTNNDLFRITSDLLATLKHDMDAIKELDDVVCISISSDVKLNIHVYKTIDKIAEDLFGVIHVCETYKDCLYPYEMYFDVDNLHFTQFAETLPEGDYIYDELPSN